MTKRFLPRVVRTGLVAVTAVLFSGEAAFAQPPGGGGEGMPWQVAALFTANWVLVAVGVAMMSRPSKRLEKPKKKEEAQE
ncbi:MAG TPA: hypothetical protein VG826_02545 [Pirellulales bacterium]|nr:hypothetical protein [Pirellulales bacterium]